MENFATTLLREKLEFTDDSGVPTVVRSNRIALALTAEGKTERVAIRTQNMHMALYMAKAAMHSYFRNGFFTGRAKPYDWAAHWEEAVSDYERIYNPQSWGAVYIAGAPVFKTGEVNSYADVVEKCALAQPENYEAAVSFAEDMLIRAGWPVDIIQETHVAAVFANLEKTMRGSIIHRARARNMTFNLWVGRGSDERLIEDTLHATGCLLEVINLKFIVENLFARLERGEIEAGTHDAVKLKTGIARVNELNRLINLFEKNHEVHYRPERPDIVFHDGKAVKTLLDPA